MPGTPMYLLSPLRGEGRRALASSERWWDRSSASPSCDDELGACPGVADLAVSCCSVVRVCAESIAADLRLAVSCNLSVSPRLQSS